MALDFDNFPVYDPLIMDETYMSDVWIAAMSTFIQTLQEYLSQYGMFVPQLTTLDRSKIQSPVLGQMIYNTNTNELQVWQVKLGVAAWRAVTTVP